MCPYNPERDNQSRYQTLYFRVMNALNGQYIVIKKSGHGHYFIKEGATRARRVAKHTVADFMGLSDAAVDLAFDLSAAAKSMGHPVVTICRTQLIKLGSQARVAV